MGQPDTDALIGKTLLGKLKVIRLLGAGGMGAVYEVQHLLTKHRRALKVLHNEYASHPEVVSRFVREAGVAGTLSSERVVETFDAGQLEDGSPYVLMEMLSGESLGSRLEREGKLPPGEMAWIISQVCEGATAAHDAGIVHRDLKPDNIFIVRDEFGEERVKLLDFGISKFSLSNTQGAAKTSAGTSMGTPWYMPPEQVQGAEDLDARADVYAIGVIMYECLSGVRPYDADNFLTLALKICNGGHKPITGFIADIDPRLADIVHRSMSASRAERVQSARDLRAQLAPFVQKTGGARIQPVTQAHQSVKPNRNAGTVPATRAVVTAAIDEIANETKLERGPSARPQAIARSATRPLTTPGPAELSSETLAGAGLAPRKNRTGVIAAVVVGALASLAVAFAMTRPGEQHPPRAAAGTQPTPARPVEPARVADPVPAVVEGVAPVAVTALPDASVAAAETVAVVPQKIAPGDPPAPGRDPSKLKKARDHGLNTSNPFR